MSKPAIDLNEKRIRKPAYKSIGLYLPLLVVIGLSMTVLTFVASMKVLGWKVPVFFATNNTPAALSKSDFLHADIVLYVSPNTDRYFTGIGGNYQRLLDPWRGYFNDRKMQVDEFKSVSEIKNLANGVIILPSSVSLNEEEKRALLEFKAKGGSILATWAVGTRDEHSTWAGWDFLAKLGIKSMGEMPADSDAHYLVLNGISPLSYSHPAGMRIWLGKTAEHPLLLSSSHLSGRVMNWARIPVADQFGLGAIVYSNNANNTGRCAAYSFAESSWESQPQPLYQLLDDTLGWLMHKPTIVRSPWPNGKQAAEAIEMDTEEGFPNALRFAALMSTIGHKSSFFILTSVAKLYPEVLNTLAQDFEIGYHGDIHTSFKDQPEAQQTQRINTMIADMATLQPKPSVMSGFRAPTEGYDKTTEMILQRKGIRYNVADPNSTEARLPFFAKLDGVQNADTLVVLPRTQRDDLNIQNQNPDVEQTAQALIDDLLYTLDMGAMGLLSIHSQNYAEDSKLKQAMPALIAELKQHRDTMWLATTGQIAQWWRDQDRFNLSSKNKGRRLEFDVTIKGNRAFEGASLTLMLPYKNAAAQITGVKTGMPEVKAVSIDEDRVSVQFDKLEPGNYAYQVTFE
jgi:peptidoglycan/xylan/chitin deacetylase (PgdA/CDA1 family)